MPKEQRRGIQSAESRGVAGAATSSRSLGWTSTSMIVGRLRKQPLLAIKLSTSRLVSAYR